MRIVALDLTNSVQRVAYRWQTTADPLSRARLLIETPPVALGRLRQMLETDHFGEPMRPDEYQIITFDHASADLAALQSVFSGFDLIVVPRAAEDDPELDAVRAWLEASTPPDRLPVLALTYWHIAPPDFGALCDWISAALFDPLDLPDAARTDFAAARDALRLTLVGRSAQALIVVTRQLTGQTIRLPAIPSAQKSAAEQVYKTLPLRVLDLRAFSALATLDTSGVLIFAVASDPGIGQSDLALLSCIAGALIVLVNTHSDSAHFVAMAAYIREQIGDAPLISDSAQIEPIIRAAAEAAIRAALLGWLDRTLPDELLSGDVQADVRYIRAVIENFRL